MRKEYGCITMNEEIKGKRLNVILDDVECFTHLANQGTPEVILQALSGHKDKRSLEAYVSPQENMLREYVVKYLHY